MMTFSLYQLALLFVHIFALIGVSRLLLATSRANGISINFYNLPAVIFGGVLLLGAVILSIAHFFWTLPVGVFIATLLWIMNSAIIPGEETPSLSRKIVFSSVVLFLWPEAITFLIFTVLNANKLNEKSKP